MSNMEKMKLLNETAIAESKLAQSDFGRSNTASAKATRLWLKVAELVLDRKPTDEERRVLFS